MPGPSFVGDGVVQAINPLTYVAPAFNANNTGHYFVDNSVTCSNSSNSGRGSPSLPRCTPPNFTSSGARLIVFGGGSYSISSYQNLPGGQPHAPTVIRGLDSAHKPLFTTDHLGNDTAVFNLVLENIHLNCAGGAGLRIKNSRNLALRGMEIENCNVPVLVLDSDHVLIANSLIHDSVRDGRLWNDPDPNFDPDSNGIHVASNNSFVWVMNNELHHIAGNGVYFGGQGSGTCAANEDVHHIYVIDNNVHDVRQVGIGFKRVTDVFVIRNYVHDIVNPIRIQEDGPGILYQYAPERVWILFNHIERTDGGIQVESDSCSPNNGQHGHIIGNLIHNIHSLGFDPANTNNHSGITLRGHTDIHVVNNTIYDVDTGISLNDVNDRYIANNIIDQIGSGYHIHFQYDGTNTKVFNNFFGGGIKLKSGSNTSTSNPNFFNNLSIGFLSSGNRSGSPGFTNPAAHDFTLAAGSQAVDSGILAPAYERFISGGDLAGFSGYGYDIKLDFQGHARPNGAGWDMGAYER